MNKIFFAVMGVAISSSLLTAIAFNLITEGQLHTSFNSLPGVESYRDNMFIHTSNAATPPTDFTKAAESSINGVVSIKSYASQHTLSSRSRGGYSDPFFEFFFGSPYNQQPQRSQPQSSEPKVTPKGLGSGVILSSDGYIVTNNHVIDGADKLEVTLNDNSVFNAKVIGTDPATDIALIKIEASDLPTITIGDSDALRVGEWVLAVGNPFGLSSTVTTGIVSAKARSVSSATNSKRMGIESFIQTDAAVNPGNSGGALVNINGELVGINSAIYSETGNYVGYSFAIPTSIVTKVVTDIKQYGTVQRGVLGISFLELTPQLAKEKGITEVNDGIYVAEVMNRSAALEAGLQVGDVITKINDTPTHNSAQLQGEISKYRPSDKINVTYLRDNKLYDTDVVLRNNQGGVGLTSMNNAMELLGCSFMKLSDAKLKEYQLRRGVQVKGISDGLFRSAGIREGFIITEINNMPVAETEDVEKIYKAIMSSSEADKVMFITGIYPNGKKVYYAVDLSE